MRIAFDSQIVSYFLLANQAGYDPPTDPDPHLARQKAAAFCLYMYVGAAVVVPTVFAECNVIRDEDRNREHFNWNAYHFSEVLTSWLDETRVLNRTNELSAFHRGQKRRKDCRIVAECEEPGAKVDMLAAFDRKLIEHLSSQARISVATPFDCLQKALPENAVPKLRLLPEHPLAAATWWKLSNVLQL